MSTKKKCGVDSRAKAAAECYIALESAQSSISILIDVPDAMRAARYTTDESKDKTLQVQVRREVERIKRDNVDPEQDWKQQHLSHNRNHVSSSSSSSSSYNCYSSSEICSTDFVLSEALYKLVMRIMK